MDKVTKILIYIVLGVVLFHALYSLFFSHSLLKDAVKDIKGVKADLKMVSDSLAISQKRIGDVISHLNESQSKITLMKKEVEILYLDYQKAGAKSAQEVKVLKDQLKEEEKNLDSLKKQLAILE